MQVMSTLVEYNNLADNYCAEALGSLSGLLMIKAATEQQFWYLDIVAHCDNMGIIKHGNAANKPCPKKQVQAYLVILVKKLI